MRNYLIKALTTTLVAGSASTVMANDVSMSFGYAELANSDTVVNTIQPWLDGVESLTDESITTEFFGGGSVVTFTTALSGIEGGLVDATMVATLSFRKELPVNTLLVDYGSTFANRQASLLATIEMTKENCPECIAEMEVFGAKVIFPWVSPVQNLICRDPITSQADLQGKRVRATGLMGHIVEEMGATPVNVTFSELYESLQRGVVDCAIVPPYWLEAISLKEVVGAFIEIDTVTNVSPTYIAVSLDFWDGLSSEQQQALYQAVPAALTQSIFADAATHARILADNSATLQHSPAPDWGIAAMERAAVTIQQEALTMAAASGVDDPQSYTDTYQALYDKWLAELGGQDLTAEAFNALLTERFYSTAN